jgi:hypothetical protein
MGSGYFVHSPVKYNGVTYKPGQEFPDTDQTTIDQLRLAGAIRLPAEAMPAKSVQDLLTERDQEIKHLSTEVQRLTAENERLNFLLAAANGVQRDVPPTITATTAPPAATTMPSPNKRSKVGAEA